MMTTCIESKKGITTNGYSRIRINNKNIQAHRWAWELVNGQIPEGFVIDHICRNRKCVLPEHLRMITQQENIMAGLHNIDNRSHCNQGHPFVKENIMIRKSGKRECAECNRIRARANYAKKVAE
jgi:hypothetical protein